MPAYVSPLTMCVMDSAVGLIPMLYVASSPQCSFPLSIFILYNIVVSLPCFSLYSTHTAAYKPHSHHYQIILHVLLQNDTTRNQPCILDSLKTTCNMKIKFEKKKKILRPLTTNLHLGLHLWPVSVHHQSTGRGFLLLPAGARFFSNRSKVATQLQIMLLNKQKRVNRPQSNAPKITTVSPRPPHVHICADSCGFLVPGKPKMSSDIVHYFKIKSNFLREFMSFSVVGSTVIYLFNL